MRASAAGGVAEAIRVGVITAGVKDDDVEVIISRAHGVEH